MSKIYLHHLVTRHFMVTKYIMHRQNNKRVKYFCTTLKCRAPWRCIRKALLNTTTHCNKLQHTTAYCNTLQHIATRCSTLQHNATHCSKHTTIHCSTLQHTHQNTLQHTTTHCSTLQHTAAYCSTLQHTATHCNTQQHTWSLRRLLSHMSSTCCSTLQHSATHSNTLQHTAIHYRTLQDTAAHCRTLQRTAAHCNTLQHTRSLPWLLSHLWKHILFVCFSVLQRGAVRCSQWNTVCCEATCENTSYIHTYTQDARRMGWLRLVGSLKL